MAKAKVLSLLAAGTALLSVYGCAAVPVVMMAGYEVWGSQQTVVVDGKFIYDNAAWNLAQTETLKVKLNLNHDTWKCAPGKGQYAGGQACLPVGQAVSRNFRSSVSFTCTTRGGSYTSTFADSNRRYCELTSGLQKSEVIPEDAGRHLTAQNEWE